MTGPIPVQTDFADVYRSLKDFQRATAEHVAERFFGADPAQRFLVADEVGLGKTLVASGVIARTIDHHLAAGTDRIDIVYVCSNAQIARQNTTRLVTRLAIPGLDRVQPIDRMTLLPQAVHDLNSRRINIVALTPGTSFNLRSSEGIARERMLLRTCCGRRGARRSCAATAACACSRAGRSSSGSRSGPSATAASASSTTRSSATSCRRCSNATVERSEPGSRRCRASSRS